MATATQILQSEHTISGTTALAIALLQRPSFTSGEPLSDVRHPVMVTPAVRIDGIRPLSGVLILSPLDPPTPLAVRSYPKYGYVVPHL